MPDEILSTEPVADEQPQPQTSTEIAAVEQRADALAADRRADAMATIRAAFESKAAAAAADGSAPPTVAAAPPSDDEDDDEEAPPGSASPATAAEPGAPETPPPEAPEAPKEPSRRQQAANRQRELDEARAERTRLAAEKDALARQVAASRALEEQVVRALPALTGDEQRLAWLRAEIGRREPKVLADAQDIYKKDLDEHARDAGEVAALKQEVAYYEANRQFVAGMAGQLQQEQWKQDGRALLPLQHDLPEADRAAFLAATSKAEATKLYGDLRVKQAALEHAAEVAGLKGQLAAVSEELKTARAKAGAAGGPVAGGRPAASRPMLDPTDRTVSAQEFIAAAMADEARRAAARR